MAVLQLPMLEAWVRFPSPAPTKNTLLFVYALHMPFHIKILNWFDEHGRHDLPWQIHSTPYRVWISEIMLQQTQVTTVIPYFQRFMRRFPDVSTLAVAPLDAVLELWTGLGYYSRARNCHKAAHIIHTHYQDEIPGIYEDLLNLPGIGRSTAGAILSLGFQKRYPILDGNVKRVLCRYFAIEGWSGTPAITQKLWTLSDKLTPTHRVHHYTQAMMDLGATLCTRSKPNCPLCPIKRGCKAYQQKAVSRYPESKPKTDKALKKTVMLMLTHGQKHVLLEHRSSTGIWGGLWSFPEGPLQPSQQLIEWIQTQLGYTVTKLIPWEPFRHTFTHIYLDIYPIQVELSSARKIPKAPEKSDAYHWHPLGEKLNRGVSSPVKRLLSELKNRLDEESQNKVK